MLGEEMNNNDSEQVRESVTYCRAVFQEKSTPSGGDIEFLDRCRPRHYVHPPVLVFVRRRLDTRPPGDGGLPGRPLRADLVPPEAGLCLPSPASRHPPHEAVHAPDTRQDQDQVPGPH